MQKIFTTYRAPVDSFPLGEMNVGITKPGRYNGFRTMNTLSGLNIQLSHNSNITVKKTDLEGNYINFGSILTPNGSIIHETTAIPFTLENNLGNANIRYDLVVCEHEYIQVVGGQPASYLIIKGDLLGNKPVIPNPEKQVGIGYFIFQPEAYQTSNIVWKPFMAPISGDQTLIELLEALDINYPDATTEIRGYVQYATEAEAVARLATDKVLSPATASAMLATETLAGMVLLANESKARTGEDNKSAMTPVQVRTYGGIRNLIEHTAGSIEIPIAWNGQHIVLNGDAGSLETVILQLPNNLGKFNCKILTGTQKVSIVKVNGQTPEVTILPTAGYEAKADLLGATIEIQSISNTQPRFLISGDLKKFIPNGASINNGIPRLGAIPYFPENNSLDEFNSSGLGISGEVIGWAICNGQNGTRDLRGRFLVQRNEQLVDAAQFGTVGMVGGSKTESLTIDQLPEHQFYTTKAMFTDGASIISLFKDRTIAAYSNNTFDGSGASPDSYDVCLAGVEQEADAGKTNRLGSDEEHNNLPPFYTTIYIQRIA